MIGSTSTETAEQKARWWIWGPIGATIAFAGYGLAAYDYEVHTRKLCEALVASNAATPSDCEKNQDDAKAFARHLIDRLSNSALLTAP